MNYRLPSLWLQRQSLTMQSERMATGGRVRQGGGEPWRSSSRRGPTGWLRDHVRIARESLGFVSSRLGTSLLVWLLIGIALALPGGLYLLQKNLDAVSEAWEGKPGLSIYFQRDATETDVIEIRDALQQNPMIGKVWMIDPETALKEFESYTGLDNALAVIQENPLPYSLRAALREEVQPVQLDLLAGQLRENPQVEEVVLEKTWMQRLNAISAVVRSLGWVLAGLFGLAAVLVTSTSVRLAIEDRLEELKVLKLVGATSAYMRRPFLYFGLLYGMGGGLVAAMLISAVLLILEPPMGRFLGSYGESFHLLGFDAGFVLGLLVIGGVLGICGALLASYQRLNHLSVV